MRFSFLLLMKRLLSALTDFPGGHIALGAGVSQWSVNRGSPVSLPVPYCGVLLNVFKTFE